MCVHLYSNSKETGFDLDFRLYCGSSVDINVLWKKSMITVTVH